MSLDDGILRMFIDEVFDVFDSDKNGYLDVDELHTFFNQLYSQLNQPRRFTQQQTREYMRTFDLQQNGIITKPELFMLFKQLTSNNNPNNYPHNHMNNSYTNMNNTTNNYAGSQPYYGQQSPYGQPQYGQPHYLQPQPGQGQGQYQGYSPYVPNQQPQPPMYYSSNNKSNNQYNPYK